MPVLTLFVWALLLAGIPALVRTVDGRLCGDRLGKLAAAAVSALDARMPSAPVRESAPDPGRSPATGMSR